MISDELKKLANEVGVISEGAYNSVTYFDQMVAQSGEKDFEPSLIYVYNDAETGFTNCLERLIATNRAVNYKSYINVFPQTRQLFPSQGTPIPHTGAASSFGSKAPYELRLLRSKSFENLFSNNVKLTFVCQRN